MHHLRRVLSWEEYDPMDGVYLPAAASKQKEKRGLRGPEWMLAIDTARHYWIELTTRGSNPRPSA